METGFRSFGILPSFIIVLLRKLGFRPPNFGVSYFKPNSNMKIDHQGNFKRTGAEIEPGQKGNRCRGKTKDRHFATLPLTDGGPCFEG